jgi:hypothetical protein
MGNSPTVIRKHYDTVKIPDEGNAWFGIMPSAPANVVPMKSASQN